jgi:hypothetical protein
MPLIEPSFLFSLRVDISPVRTAGHLVYAQWQVIREPMFVAAVPALGPRERTPGNLPGVFSTLRLRSG